MRIAITVDEWQAQDAHIDTLSREKQLLCREFTYGIRVNRVASIVLVSEAAAIVSVGQSGTQKDKTCDVCGARGTDEILRSALVDCMRLLWRRASEKCGTMHDCGGALDSKSERFGVQEVTLR